MANKDDPSFDLEGCCSIPNTVEARTIRVGLDRRAFSKRAIRAGEVVLRNAPTAYTVLTEYARERCAFCLSINGKQKPLLRCGACKRIRYCSRDCQKRDFPVHKIECKATMLLQGASNHASLLVRNFVVLRVLRRRRRHSNGCFDDDDGSVRCGPHHFDGLLRYNNALDGSELLDIKTAARALWHQRTTLHKMARTTSTDDDDKIVLFRNAGELEAQLRNDMRRFRVNNFGITDPMLRVVASGVYPLGALLNHSCAPNCLLRYTLDDATGNAPIMEIVAARDIAPREELTHSYVELVSPQQSRRETLRSVYGFDCRCLACSTPNNPSRIYLPSNFRSLPPRDLTRWILDDCRPERTKKNENCGRVGMDPDLLLRPISFEPNSDIGAKVEAARSKQREAGHFVVNGDDDGELAASKDAVQLWVSVLASTRLPLSLELYKARCDRLSSLIVNHQIEEAVIECEHVVAFLCLVLHQVPNHSLLGLQLFTLGDLYEANGNDDERAQSTYRWARQTLRIGQGTASEMVRTLNQKIR